MKKLTIFCILMDILIVIAFVVVYGPFTDFQDMIIMTAKDTKTHDYIAYTFWSEKRVEETMAKYSYVPLTADVNLDDIVIDSSPKEKYDNEYEEAILTRDQGNDLYKYLKIKVGKYDAHLVAIYDPSTVHLLTCKKFNTGNNSGKETVLSMAKRYGAKVAINAGRFNDTTGYGSDVPIGYVIKDGKVIWSDNNEKRGLIGFTKDNKLLLKKASGKEAIELGMRDAIEFGPFLIVNGESIKFKASSVAGGYSRAARVAIAQRKDGIVLFVVTEGTHSSGPNLLEMVQTLEKYGAYNAANLDGGSSTQLVINNKLTNDPRNVFGKKINGGRSVVTGWGVIPGKE